MNKTFKETQMICIMTFVRPYMHVFSDVRCFHYLLNVNVMENRVRNYAQSMGYVNIGFIQ